LMRGCGTKAEPTVFIFTDSSVKQESFLEDINSILNTGEVPNIFPPDEKADIQDSVRKPAKEEGRCPEGTPAQLYSYFVERCKQNLHIVICFSPIGDSLRNRCRDFPSLINCTTIDWFSEWPKDALESVARRFLGEIQLADDVRDSCVDMVQSFHTTTKISAARFLREQKRQYYVTPTSYLELINSFKRLLKIKRDEVKTLKDRYTNGYNTLIETENKVGTMREQLEALQPQLVEKSKEVEVKSTEVEAATIAAEKVREVVSAETAVAQESADAANAIKTRCEGELAKAIPALQAAEKALDSIQKKDVTDMKTVKVLHEDVERSLKGVMILFDIVPEKKMDPTTQKRVEEWGGPAKKMLGDIEFLAKIKGYDKEGITEQQILKLQPLVTHENFNMDHMKGINRVAANICSWVIAMESFYKVNLVVRPMKEELKVAEAKFAKVDAELSIKKEALRKKQAEVDGLRAELQAIQD